jgi:hypothetical protein
VIAVIRAACVPGRFLILMLSHVAQGRDILGILNANIYGFSMGVHIQLGNVALPPFDTRLFGFRMTIQRSIIHMTPNAGLMIYH